MPPGIQLQLTMTLGDFIVAGTTVIAIVAAYYAVKNTLASLAATTADLKTTVGEHADTIGVHGEKIAALNTKVFGRRSGDREREPA